MDIIKGRVVYKLGDDIGTDMILAGRYLMLTGDQELAEHCFEGHIKDWKEKVKEGDILVMPPGDRHSFTGIGPALLLEASTPSTRQDNFFANKAIGESGII